MAVNSQYAGLVATWTIDPVKIASAENKFLPDAGPAESVFQPDYRCCVDKNDYMDGGKYRPIVKLEMAYEGFPPGSDMASMGTGWLIRPDLLVTAGHCVYDHSGNDGQGYGRVSVMQCHIGYNGRDSLKDPSVQTRFAKRIVTTGEWIDSRNNRHRDVAFVQLDKAFEGNLRLFTYANTPMKGSEMIGVVGYPGDMHLVDKDGIDEAGAQMYELFQEVKYDRDGNALKMLQYRLSSFGGQSGAPIIRKKAAQTSIGVHCYGGADKNSASAIGSQYGNDFDALLSVLATSYPTFNSVKAVAGVNFVQPNLSAPTKLDSQLLIPTTPSPSVTVEGEEGLFDAIKSVACIVGKVGKAVSPIASPLLGPLGGPLSVLAGTALSTISNVATAESTMVNVPQVSQGISERAVLAEATLQSVLRITDPDLSHKMMREMYPTYSELAPHITNLAPKLTPVLKDSALRLAVDQDYLRKSKDVKFGDRRPITDGAESVSLGTLQQAPFVDGLLSATRPVDGEEGFFSDLTCYIGKGIKKAGPFVSKGAKIGIQILNSALAPSGEESTSRIQPEDNSDLGAATLLIRRSVLAEAALRAVMTLNKEDFAKATASQEESMFGPEGFFDGIKSMVQVIGSAVSKVVPKVVSTVLPIAADALKKKLSDSKVDGSLPVPAVRKRPSFADMSINLNSGPTLEVSAISNSAPSNRAPAMVKSIAIPVEGMNEFMPKNRDGLIIFNRPGLHENPV